MATTSTNGDTTVLSRTRLYDAVALQSGLPAELLDATRYAEGMDRTITQLRTRLFGQNIALSKMIGILKARIAERFVGWEQSVQTLHPTWDNRPIACLLAVGPTGVGKTQTARLLAQLLFNGRLISLNGSEVPPDAPHGTSMWTGSPPGYVGSDRGGILTNGLREHRSGVIVIDELEKADRSAIQNILVPLMGEGVINDKNNGESLFATDFVVFCTTNIPVDAQSLQVVGFNRRTEDDLSDQTVFEALSAHLLPEVLGRFNGILAYRDLTLEAQWQVWSLLRRELCARIGPGTQILLTTGARQFVQQMLGQMQTGARGIQDFFLQQVVPLAVGIDAGRTITVGVEGARLVPIKDNEVSATT